MNRTARIIGLGLALTATLVFAGIPAWAAKGGMGETSSDIYSARAESPTATAVQQGIMQYHWSGHGGHGGHHGY